MNKTPFLAALTVMGPGGAYAVARPDISLPPQEGLTPADVRAITANVRELPRASGVD